MEITKENIPEIVSEEEWLVKRLALLKKEKELTQKWASVNAERRRLPMVKVEKEYHFEAPQGTVRLIDLFGKYQQLIVYHFMLDPEWTEGCPGCSFIADNMGHQFTCMRGTQTS